ncbi:glycosyltransferase [Planococcus sp. 107-1]|uniref:glycosyltransferase n=1 Tax=Planococcus sp. 107-1 TaxID=2908840 RepID=UPI001F336E4B|nr:glycosyltransferase [Planococcus sp. 107-1]UJF26170.1 glycosyltransferase [Planococcus sp. 107-1]
MKIIINNMAATSGGGLSILKGFYEYLIKSKEAKNHEWVFLLNDNYIKETKNIKVIVFKKNWIRRLKFDYISGKKIIKKFNPDVVFSMQNTITYGLDVRQVVYMHQSIPFQKTKKFSFFKANERKLAVYQHIIGSLIIKSLKKADKIIVQTKWIKEAIVHKAGISSLKIENILPPMQKSVQLLQRSSFNKEKFFYPASKISYKNHSCIYEAAAILNNDGITNFSVDLTIKENKEVKNINFLGALSFEEVLENYKNSTLIFPSLIETVGLPLIEAKQLGIIILAADCEYAREILSGYKNAYYFNPYKPKELAKLIDKVIKGEIKKHNIEVNFNDEINTWSEVVDILIK